MSSLLEDLFGKKKPEISKPLVECRNCTYYRPLEGYYGWCGKKNAKLSFNQAPLCPDYMAFGEVTVSALDAGVLTSGLLDLARIPKLDLTKIPLGTSGYFLKGQGASDSIYALLAAGDIPSLDASKITTGTFGDARLDLSALTQDINITKATPTIKLQRTTGPPTIEFNDVTHNFQVIMHVTAQELRILYDGGYIFQMDKTGKITKGLILTWDLASKMGDLATIWDKTTKILTGDISWDIQPSEPTRSLGTNYQNTTEKVLMVNVCCKGTGGTGGNAGSEAKIGSSSPPTDVISRFAFSMYLDIKWTHSFLVPINWYYRVDTIGSNVGLDFWKEQKL